LYKLNVLSHTIWIKQAHDLLKFARSYYSEISKQKTDMRL